MSIRSDSGRQTTFNRRWSATLRIQAGTIEQVYLSPLPSWLVAAAGRVVAALAETAVVGAATYGIVRAFVPLRIDWNVAAVLPAVMVLVAGIGVSLIVAFAVGERVAKRRGTLGSY